MNVSKSRIEMRKDMTRKSADMIGYEEITLLGTPALLTFERLFRDSVPKGMFLYELRHADEMWGGPCQLAEKILVNFYGSILTTDPIQLPVDGYLDFNKGDLVNTGGYYQKIQNFRKKYPSAGRDIMRFSVLKPEEYPFLYSHETECDQACHCIGHVRGDFDMNKVLHTTWWPHHQDDVLNTPRFKADLQRVVEWLRKGFAPLRDLETMGRFCSLFETAAKLPGDVEKVYGFRVDTKNYMYALRCTPEEGAYHVYLYCYGKEDRENV